MRGREKALRSKEARARSGAPPGCARLQRRALKRDFNLKKIARPSASVDCRPEQRSLVGVLPKDPGGPRRRRPVLHTTPPPGRSARQLLLDEDRLRPGGGEAKKRDLPADAVVKPAAGSPVCAAAHICASKLGSIRQTSFVANCKPNAETYAGNLQAAAPRRGRRTTPPPTARGKCDGVRDVDVCSDGGLGGVNPRPHPVGRLGRELCEGRGYRSGGRPGVAGGRPRSDNVGGRRAA